MAQAKDKADTKQAAPHIQTPPDFKKSLLKARYIGAYLASVVFLGATVIRFTVYPNVDLSSDDLRTRIVVVIFFVLLPVYAIYQLIKGIKAQREYYKQYIKKH